MFSVYIDNGERILSPSIVDGLTWESEKAGAPGKLIFDAFQDEALEFEEGNVVMLKDGDVGIFYGFVFIKKQDPKKRTVKVTCYDQLRYLKNQETYTYTNKTLAEVVSMIAEDFRLNIGELAETSYKIPSRIEEDKSLFDIIQAAIDETLKNTATLYVLYDDFGGLTLKNVEDMKLDILIDGETAQSYDYTSSIDGETYNKVKLSKSDDGEGVTGIYIAQDSESINKWGMLLYNGDADDTVNPTVQADVLLELYNRPEKKLTIKGIIGDVRMRAGASIVIRMNLGDVSLSNYMMITKAKHKIKDNEHFADLSLVGGEFSVY